MKKEKEVRELTRMRCMGTKEINVLASVIERQGRVANWAHLMTDSVYKMEAKRQKEAKEKIQRKNKRTQENKEMAEMLEVLEQHVERQQPTRTKFHRKAIMDWLATRHKSTTLSHYLFTPEEIKKRIDFKKIFATFDADHSHTLEMEEFLEMFIENFVENVSSTHKKLYEEMGITDPLLTEKPQHQRDTHHPQDAPHTDRSTGSSKEREIERIQSLLQEGFEELYKTVTNDRKKMFLYLPEFISLAMDEEARTKYAESIRNLKENVIKKLKYKSIAKEIEFMPTSFEKMLAYLSYRTKREELCHQFIEESEWGKKMGVVKEIFANHSSELNFLETNEINSKELEENTQKASRNSNKHKGGSERDFFGSGAGEDQVGSESESSFDEETTQRAERNFRVFELEIEKIKRKKRVQMNKLIDSQALTKITERLGHRKKRSLTLQPGAFVRKGKGKKWEKRKKTIEPSFQRERPLKNQNEGSFASFRDGKAGFAFQEEENERKIKRTFEKISEVELESPLKAKKRKEAGHLQKKRVEAQTVHGAHLNEESKEKSVRTVKFPLQLSEKLLRNSQRASEKLKAQISRDESLRNNSVSASERESLAPIHLSTFGDLKEPTDLTETGLGQTQTFRKSQGFPQRRQESKKNKGYLTGRSNMDSYTFSDVDSGDQDKKGIVPQHKSNKALSTQHNEYFLGTGNIFYEKSKPATTSQGKRSKMVLTFNGFRNAEKMANGGLFSEVLFHSGRKSVDDGKTKGKEEEITAEKRGQIGLSFAKQKRKNTPFGQGRKNKIGSLKIKSFFEEDSNSRERNQDPNLRVKTEEKRPSDWEYEKEIPEALKEANLSPISHLKELKGNKIMLRPKAKPNEKETWSSFKEDSMVDMNCPENQCSKFRNTQSTKIGWMINSKSSRVAKGTSPKMRGVPLREGDNWGLNRKGSSAFSLKRGFDSQAKSKEEITCFSVRKLEKDSLGQL